MDANSYKERLEMLSNTELVQEFLISKFIDRNKLIQELVEEDVEELSPEEEAEEEVDVQVADGQDRDTKPTPKRTAEDKSLSGIDMSKIPQDLKQRLNIGDGDDRQGASTDTGSKSKIVDQDNPPSMGTGHRGQVTDPDTDRRLKKNEDPELQERRSEAGKKGGEATAERHGSDFYSAIGKKGGESPGGRREENQPRA